MSTRFFPSSFASVGVVSVISLASIGLAGAPVNARKLATNFKAENPV
ncbi:MAG: hypothetical protein RIM23_18350 [Coleofasciculus sp. G3-WIS-01]